MKRIDLTSYMTMASRFSYFLDFKLDFENGNAKAFAIGVIAFKVVLDGFIERETEIEPINPRFLELQKQINEYLEKYKLASREEVFGIQQFGEASVLYEFIKNSQVVLISDLAQKFAYRVTRKDEYNIDILINEGHKIFPESTRQFFSDQTKFDIDAGLRCLAFELPTAFGFHLFRAVETLMVELYEKRVGTLPGEAQRNWGNYINHLNGEGKTPLKEKTPPEVIEQLKALKNNHRNPLLHPSDNLEMPEAFELLGLLKSVMSRLIKEINNT